MKGIELPVNILVIIAIAVIVLLGLIGLYMAGMLGPGISIQQRQAWNTGCGAIVTDCGKWAAATEATWNATKVSVAGTTMGMLGLCKIMTGSSTFDNRACARACGCTV